MMKKLAEGLGVRDTLEDLCKRDPVCRLAELGRKGKKEEDPPRDRVIPKNKWCEYLANQATEGLGSTMWMKYKECNSWIRAGTFTNSETIDAILYRTNCIPTCECIARYKKSMDTKCRQRKCADTSQGGALQ